MFFWTLGRYNRPTIKVDVYRVFNEYKHDVWNIFRKYHYLNTDLHQAATQYIGVVNGEVVCHSGVIQTMMKENSKQVHRLVVLPDYQGIGIGTKFISFIASQYAYQNYVFNLITTTPAIRYALLNNNEWRLKRSGKVKANLDRLGNTNMAHWVNSASCNRETYTFVYQGRKTKPRDYRGEQIEMELQL